MELEAKKQIDAVCLAFEKQLQNSASPRLEDFVGEVPSESRGELLKELLHLDVACRLRDGEDIDNLDFLKRFPEHEDIVLAVLDEAGASWENAETCNIPDEVRSLSDFEIIRELGRGGMGVVYEAKQRSLKRRVALKVVAPRFGMSATAVMRFRRETEAAGRLHHTNIIPIYATGEENGVHYYAMEFIHGPSLDRVIKEMRAAAEQDAARSVDDALAATVVFRESEASDTGPTGVHSSLGDSSRLNSNRDYFDQVARMMAEVAEALEHAHEQGVVHRDIKPANLLVGPEQHLSVTDFGLARMLEEPGMTMSGELVGSPLYMSPEQIAVGRMSLDHRTDIYSLGATLYELLTLKPPFPGQSRDQVISQILTKEPPPPRSTDRRVPRDLETICLKAIEKDPDRRYQRAGQMAADLRRHVDRHAISARRIGITGRTVRWVRRHPALSIALGCVCVLLIGLGAVLWRADAAARKVEREKALAEIDRTVDDAIDAAFRGDLQRAIQYVDKAETISLEQLGQAGSERAWSHMIPGIVSLYGNFGASSGKMSDAVVYFDRVHQSEPQNVSATALLAVAQLWSGRWQDYEQTVADLKDVLTPEDPIERFLLGQAFLWSDSARAVELIEPVREDTYWANSPVVSIMYAEALGHHAWHTNSAELADKSVTEANRAVLISNNLPGPVAISNWSHMVAVSIRKAADLPYDDLLQESEQFAKALADPKYRDLVIGYPCRAWYHDALGEEGNTTAINLLRECLETHQGTGWIAGMYAAEMYRFHRSAEALEVLSRIDEERRDAAVDASRAFLIWDTQKENGLDEIEAICRRHEQRAIEKRDSQSAAAAVSIRLIVGDIESARQFVANLRKSTPAIGPRYLEFLDSATPEETLKNLPGQRMNECLARYMIGLVHLAEENSDGRAKARSVLAPAVKAGGLGINPQTHWIRAVYERIH